MNLANGRQETVNGRRFEARNIKLFAGCCLLLAENRRFS